MVVNLYLIERVKSVVVTLVVAATNQVKLLSEWVLNTLEIMGEATVVVWLHLDGLYGLVTKVELVNIFGVFLRLRL